MSENLLYEAVLDLRREWELPDVELTEQQILDALAKRVAAMLSNSPESFFQLMYRIDISERNVVLALKNEYPADTLARLIYKRQMQKLQSRATHRKDENIDDDLRY